MNTNRKIICLTPIKNEAWILDFFIRSTSLWSDYIIIADQGSTDGSRQIAQKYDKVILIENQDTKFNEPERQKLLLEAARKIEGENNVFMALDADEILVNYENNPEWELLFSANASTTFWIPWLNVLPEMKEYYESRGGKLLVGYVNDGKTHNGIQIHSPRVPSDRTEKCIAFKDVKILHFQYAYNNRLKSKHRWYECLEKIKFPTKNNIDIYRQYHHIDLPIYDSQKINSQWLESLHSHGLYIKDIKDDSLYWWDKEVCMFFEKYGVEKFRKVAIWYVEWNKIYKSNLPEGNTSLIYDPRNIIDKKIHIWLANSQTNRFGFWNKVINKILRIYKW